MGAVADEVGFEQYPFFRLVFAGQDACNFFQHFFAGDLGQETEVALIHSYEGDAVGGDFAGGGKEGAVAAQNDDQAAFAADVVFVGQAAAGEVVGMDYAAFHAFAVDEYVDFFRQQEVYQFVQADFYPGCLRAGNDADAFEFGNHGGWAYGKGNGTDYGMIAGRLKAAGAVFSDSLFCVFKATAMPRRCGLRFAASAMSGRRRRCSCIRCLCLARPAQR